MTLYHGSDAIIEKPEIRLSGRTLDYGSGFYTTTSFNQAKQWTERKLKRENAEFGFVNMYSFDKTAATVLDCKAFESASDEWLDFVMLNRTKRGYAHNYDIVCGPVADDRVYAAFALYEGGILSRQGLIAELKTYKLVDQYLFHTERSLCCLRFMEARKISFQHGDYAR